MNGLEALEEMIETFDSGGYQPTTIGCVDGAFKEVFSAELPIIERELKVLQILKEKKVDLAYIRNSVWYYNSNIRIMRIENPNIIEWLVKQYKFSGMLYQLTLEEMQLIVEWLKGE